MDHGRPVALPVRELGPAGREAPAGPAVAADVQDGFLGAVDGGLVGDRGAVVGEGDRYHAGTFPVRTQFVTLGGTGAG